MPEDKDQVITELTSQVYALEQMNDRYVCELRCVKQLLKDALRLLDSKSQTMLLFARQLIEYETKDKGGK